MRTKEKGRPPLTLEPWSERTLEAPGQAAPGGHQVEMQLCSLSSQTIVSRDDFILSSPLQ